MNLDFRFYLSLFTRRLHYFLLFLAIGAAIGITLALVLPPVYRAQAVLLVESEQSDLIESTVQAEATEQMQIIQQRILTRESLLEMANRLRVYEPQPGQEVVRMAADDIVEDMRERISIAVTGGASRRGPTEATIVRVEFPAPSARLSASVVNEVVTLIQQENIEIRTGAARNTRQFFQDRVDELDQELSAQGAAILAFKEANINALPDSLDFRRSQQAAWQERQLVLQREAAGLRDRRERLVQIFAVSGCVDTTQPDRRQTPEERRLQELQDELADMLTRLAPTHPRAVALQGRVEAAEAAVVASNTGVTPEVAAVEGQLTPCDIQLADLDGQLDFIAVQQDQLANDLDEVAASIAATPGNSVTLATLERDFQNTQEQYNAVVSRLAAAETSDTIETLGRAGRISVIENAVAPQEPDSPNRPLLAAAGIGGGMFVGLALIALMELLNSSIRRPVDISNKLGVTPLGTIPHIRTRWEIVRRRLILLVVFGIVLVVVPIALWFVHTQIMPLDTAVNRVLNRFGLPLI